MTYIKGTDRNQMQIAVSLEDLIPEDNPVRAIDAFVESLEMGAMGFKKVKPAYTGRPPYDPRALLKLYIYGYMNKIRSSRNLMRECHRNIELFFLLEQLTPDFRTISDFRKDNSDAIKQCFYVFTQLCISLNLYDIHEILSIDGSKFRAVNGNKKMFNDKILDSKLERIEKKISEYLELLAKEDEAETSIDNTPPNPKEHLTTLKQRKKLYESRTCRNR